MRAVTYTEYGGPEVLAVAEVPEPHAAAGQIRIVVRAASVNPIDWKLFSGTMAGGRPMTGTGYLGYDAAGVVDEVGDGVTGVSVGADVLGCGRGTQAEYAVLDSWAAKPPSIDWAVAAAAGVSGETAERVLCDLLGVKGRRHPLFVDGGSGGGGRSSVQMAVGRGVSAVIASGRPGQPGLPARDSGATPVRYGAGGGRTGVRAAAGGPQRSTAIFDVVGKTPVKELVGSPEPEPSKVVSYRQLHGLGETGVPRSPVAVQTRRGTRRPPSPRSQRYWGPGSCGSPSRCSASTRRPRLRPARPMAT